MPSSTISISGNNIAMPTGGKVTNLGTPTASTDAVTKAYADALSPAITESSVRTATSALTAALPFNAQKGVNVANGTASSDVAAFGQIAAAQLVLNEKPTVNAVATSNQATLTGLAQTIDGVALSVAGMRVALTNQTTGTQTGIYLVASGAWTLIPELLSGASAAGVYFVCKTGTANKGVWVVTNAAGSDVVGTATLAFVNVAGSGGSVTESQLRTAAAALTASLAVNAQKITGLANGTVTTDAVALGQLLARNNKPTVNAVATSNQATLSGLAQTVDGVALNTAGMSVALTNQTTGTQTGIYAVASGAWTLIPELASGSSAFGAFVVCESGTSNKGVWVCTNAAGSDVVGTNTLTFVNVAGAGGGGVSSVSGTAPIVSSGGSTPAISITVATSGNIVADSGAKAAGASGTVADGAHVHGTTLAQLNAPATPVIPALTTAQQYVDTINPANVLHMGSDFASGVAAGATMSTTVPNEGGMISIPVGAGASTIYTTGRNTDTIIGSVTLQPGTATNGSDGVCSGPGGANGGTFQPKTSARVVLDIKLSIPTLSTSTDKFTTVAGGIIGLINLPTDGIWFSHEAVADAHWICNTKSSAGAHATATASTVTVVAAQEYHLVAIKAAGADSVDFYIDGVFICTIATDVPTTANLLLAVNSLKIAGTTAGKGLVNVDWAYCTMNYVRAA